MLVSQIIVHCCVYLRSNSCEFDVNPLNICLFDFKRFHFNFFNNNFSQEIIKP